MSDELVPKEVVGGGTVGALWLLKVLLERFFRKGDSELAELKHQVELLRQEQTSSTAKLVERTNAALDDHKNRLQYLEGTVAKLEGRDQGIQLALKAFAGDENG